MRSGKHQVIHRSGYRVPDYWIDRADLYFDLGEEVTVVVATLSIRRNAEIRGEPVPLVLDGEELELHRVSIDGRVLDPREYHVEDDELHIARTDRGHGPVHHFWQLWTSAETEA